MTLLEVRSLSRERIDDWLRCFEGGAFEDNPEWSSCYCLEGYMERAANDALADSAERRRTALEFIRNGTMKGYLAYADGKVIG